MTHGSTSNSTPAPGRARSLDPELSITDFLTDGSLAALCAEISVLTGVQVQLRDTKGNAIVRRDQPASGEAAWMSVPVAHAPHVGSARAEIPLNVSGIKIGSFVVGEENPTATVSDVGRRLTHAIELLAGAAAELCTHDLELKHRVKELAALTRMSSLLVGSTAPDRVLEVALDSALEVLGLDAGAIVLFAEDSDGVLSTNEADLTLKASRNLSRNWLDDPSPLSKDRLFDKQALAGEIVVSEDLAKDDRINIRDKAVAEGLGAAIHVGLVFRDRPIGVMRLYSRHPRSFDQWDKHTVSSLAQQAAAALEQSRLLSLEREEQRIQRQLELAADVQRRMLPQGMPSIPSLDVAAKYIPSFELGGDFYDLIDLNGHLGLAVGDVAGKGIAAALLMSAVRASLRAHVQGVYNIDDVVEKVNGALCLDTRDNEFASLWYGVIDPAKLRLTYCSAGHEPPLIMRAKPGQPLTESDLIELSVGGMVVGIDRTQTYQRSICELKPGDVIMAYTDGLIDTTDFAGKRFGKKRLRQALVNCYAQKPDPSAGDVLEHVQWELRQFAGLSPRTDDRTIVVIKVRR